MKPEKLVEQEVLAWAFMHRWCVNVFDSGKIVRDKKAHENTGLPSGCSDLVGNDNNGLAVYVELKDPKKDKVCRLSQHQFLSRKIESNAFACVVSSAKRLEEIYSTWLSLRGDMEKARSYLKDQLPTKVLVGKKVLNLLEP